MNKKALRYSFNVVINAAETLKCKDLHHTISHRHDDDELCPAEYLLQKHAQILRNYMKENI